MKALSVAAAAEDAGERLALVGDEALGDGWSYARLASELRARVDRRDDEDDGPRVLTPEGHLEDVLAVLAALEGPRPLVLLHPRWSEREREAARQRIRAAKVRSKVVIFSSGTSGQPKAVCLSRAALVAAVEAHARALPFRPGDRWLTTMPLAHIGGLGALLRVLAARSTLALGPARFDGAAVVEAMRRSEATLVSLVPTMLDALDGPPPRSLRAALLGGAATSPHALARGRAVGWPLLPTYGASETCGQIATQRLESLREAGVGAPLPGVVLSFVAATGERMIAKNIDDKNVDGEILVRGPTLMDGYLDEPSPFVDGAFPTGDLGHLDAEGHLHVTGRADARIVSGGENVDPAEVEAALLLHPALRAACVVGVPDARWGQRVAAALVARGAPPTLAALRVHLADHLAAYKHPRALTYLEALPLLASGKPDRRTLTALLARAHAT